MTLRLQAALAIICAATLTAGCSKPPNDVLAREVSPDGKLVAVALLCPNGQTVGGQILIGAVFRAETARADCDAMRDPGALASFNSHGGDRRQVSTPAIAWTAADRVVMTVTDEVIAATSHRSGMEKLLEVRVAPASGTKP